MAKSKYNILIVMGVSGCGKSTIGELLAKKLDLPFFDGDNYHPKKNVEKMANGIPLNDNDRTGWLQALNALAIKHKVKGAVIVCSALKNKYRELLSKDLYQSLGFIYLHGSYQVIMERLQKRKGHFMPSGLLESQFETLEIPINAIKVSIDTSPDRIVEEICTQLVKT